MFAPPPRAAIAQATLVLRIGPVPAHYESIATAPEPCVLRIPLRSVHPEMAQLYRILHFPSLPRGSVLPISFSVLVLGDCLLLPPCSPWAVFHIWFLIRSSAIAVQRCTDIDKSANPLANPRETPFASFRGRLNTESQTRASDIFIAVLWVTMSSVVLGVQALESYVVVIFGKG